MANYDVGDAVRVTATFTDLDGGAADPTVVTFKVKDPFGVITEPGVHLLDTGVYFADVVLSHRGIWRYRWEGAGLLQSAAEGSLNVRASSF